MQTRRKFLRWSALGLPFVSFSQILAKSKTPFATKPIVVSTWDSGLPVNAVAWKILREQNGRALDAVEAGARSIEDSINCCVGLGGNPDRDGIVTLDACIMDEKSNCGSVAGLSYIKHPISVARKIMETTPHVMLVGDGALQFALANGFPKESGKLSKDADKAYKAWLKKSEYKPIINIEQQQIKAKKNKGNGPFAPNKFEDGSPNHDTMGTIALDAAGNLSGACTTSGMAFKLHGRVGDSPIIGAGLFVDNEVGAVTGSGQGEEVIRVAGAALIVEMMRMGKSPKEACKVAIERIVKINPEKAKTFQVGFIAINKAGEYGAYSLQPGFSYSVTMAEDGGKVYMADSYL
ncbi:MAG: N(4)-(beta-N-acetylglucosaminyl)-L-asparaginase [Haliscomenobacter sp.]|uniref:isoaspartyl peptidase/L-asparaginase family protein n=1 Tax=Haliscomenobacter sp. TaxID=2717303 RepID=UPI0029B37D70|nr:N(4)-(beta-N-acetylglucosaminyl)-L-asparaginase [Haliscomenobacter sp.]MDX2068757.1 N(4)-(beta-N-acetylglucosaminyl)-L-asparaginase [Haliscomenobacter sp.]